MRADRRPRDETPFASESESGEIAFLFDGTAFGEGLLENLCSEERELGEQELESEAFGALLDEVKSILPSEEIFRAFAAVELSSISLVGADSGGSSESFFFGAAFRGALGRGALADFEDFFAAFDFPSNSKRKYGEVFG